MTFIRSTLGAAVLSAAVLAPASSALADAPYRFTGVDLVGDQANAVKGVAVGPGAKEVLFEGWGRRDRYEANVLLRDVVGAKTTSLAGASSWVVGASDDLSRVLVWTYDRLDPADTNSYGDQYLIDRRAGKTILLSRDWPGGPAYGYTKNVTPAISGDGNTVHLSVDDLTDEVQAPELWTIDLAKSSATRAGSGYLRRYDSDTTGKVLVTSDAVLTGGRTIPVPGDDGHNFVSPNGSAAALKLGSAVTIVDTVAGTTRDAVLADFLRTNPYDLLGVADGGDTIYVGAVIAAAGGKKYAVATQNTRTGALNVVRSDIPWVAQSGSGVLSPDLAFIGFGTHVAQLGATTLPGPNVAIPEVPNNEFLPGYPGCSYGGILNQTIRPSVVLRGSAIGINGRRPTKADVLVTVDRNGAVANRFTITPGARKSLSTGWGGFTITSRIQYSDGTTSTGIRKVPVYTPPKNDRSITGAGGSRCTDENNLL